MMEHPSGTASVQERVVHHARPFVGRPARGCRAGLEVSAGLLAGLSAVACPAGDPPPPREEIEPEADTVDLLYEVLTEQGFPHLRVRRAIKFLGASVKTLPLEELTKAAIDLLMKPRRRPVPP